MPEEQNKAVIRRFYGELWNLWRLEVADEVLSSGVRFRGSLGSTHEGRDDFKRYVEEVRAAFPDWHNQVDEILAVDDRVVTRKLALRAKSIRAPRYFCHSVGESWPPPAPNAAWTLIHSLIPWKRR